MAVWKPVRDLIWVAFSACAVSVSASGQTAKAAPVCKWPADLEKVLHAHPSAADYDALGAYFGQQRKFSCAITAFESAVRLEPNSWEARYNLGLALLQTHQSERATREFRVAIKVKPEDPLAHTALGMALSELDRDSEAVDEFKLALKADPKAVPALDGLAKALISQKRYSAAIAYLKDEHSDPRLQNDLAIAYSKSGEIDRAVDLLSDLVKQNPSSAENHGNLAIAYTQQQQFRQAADEFRESLRLDPENDVVRLSYVKSLVILAEFNTALPEIQNYFNRKPRTFDAQYLMGVVDRGQLKPDSSEAHFQLAAVLRSLGQPQKAQEELQTFQQQKQESIQGNVAGTKVNQANEYLR